MNSTNERAARWPSLSLSTSPETAKNIVNAVMSGGPIEDRPRARRPVKRQGSLSNSFTTSKNAVDNRTLVGPAGTAPMPQGKKAGIFQSFRRRTMLDEHVVPDNRPIHSMANFQQIFNEMKAENPTASLGAVQHMTVMKLSKIRDQKVGEEKIRELDNNGRGSNTFVTEGRYNSIATKTMNKFVDAIRVGTFDEGENAKKSWNKSAFNESNEATSTNGEGEGLQLFQNFRRRSSNNSNSALPKRRVSQESAGARTLTDFNASEQSLNNNEHCAKARTANEMYAIAANEQGANMAPRKSISDFTAMLSVADHSDQSKGCGDSIKSDLSGLILEELARSARSLEAELDVNKGDVEDDDGSLQESGRDVLEAFTLSIGEAMKPHKPDTIAQHETISSRQWIETQFGKPTGRLASPKPISNDESCELNHSRHSDTKSAISGLSGYSDCTSACSDGLIVGFRPRNCSETSRDEDHLNTGNFASDFSAWDRR